VVAVAAATATAEATLIGPELSAAEELKGVAPTEAEVWAAGTWVGNEHLNLLVPGLYLGDIEAAQSGPWLKLGGVTHVVDLSNSTVDATQLRRGAASKNTHYQVRHSAVEGVCDWAEATPSVEAKLVVRVDDEASADLRPHFAAMNKFIAHGNKKIEAMGARSRFVGWCAVAPCNNLG
jgi:hypothetical protein